MLVYCFHLLQKLVGAVGISFADPVATLRCWFSGERLENDSCRFGQYDWINWRKQRQYVTVSGLDGWLFFLLF
jgi:hypothetical protein